jgi:hypothetical protein
MFVCDTCCPPLGPERLVPVGGPDHMLLHSKLYSIAEKYDASGLKEVAKEKFSRACIAFGQKEDFISATQHAFTTTPDDDDGLRQIVLSTLAVNKKILKRSDVQAFLEARPVLMYHVLLQTTQ